MEPQSPQFTGPPYGHYGTYTFYRGLRYTKEGRSKDLSLGDFFFVRISAHEDPCIGELQLLCANRNNDQQVSALRLYFLPEQTPDGRLSHHGEDEVLVASDRVVLKLDDLVSWITEEVEWNHGIFVPQCRVKVENNSCYEESTEKDAIKAEPKEEIQEKNTEETKTAEVKTEPDENAVDSKETKVVVLSYQKYCRYRTILRRLEGGEDHWLQDPLVIALGGLAFTSQKTRILFCRDNFEHDELAHHELNCEYLAPQLKGKKRKRKTKNARSTSPESNSSEECKILEIKNTQKINGIKQPPIKSEQEFLQRLFKFMKQRNTPIHRVPHLGFKQIDLYVFYSFAQKLGGYDKITGKRLWKHVYDELGGNPGSTSAATCTRRHYERLLLPFERFMDGITYKPASRNKKSQKKRQDKENSENSFNSDNAIRSEPAANTNAEGEDAYNFTDSNHENSNSKDSNSNEFNSTFDEQPTTVNDSEEDSKTIWSIQKQPENKDEEVDKEEKSIKPLIIQKGQGETFAEKERKWDEIRRKNAAARKWVRQSRSSKGCKTPDVTQMNHELHATSDSGASDSRKSPVPVMVKTENNELPPQNVPTFPHHKQASQDNASPASSGNNTNQSLPIVHSESIQNVINRIENQKKLQGSANDSCGDISYNKKSSYVKSEAAESPAKNLNSFSLKLEHPHQQSSPCVSKDSITQAHLKTQYPSSATYKSGTVSEPDYVFTHTGRQSVGSVSVSSVVSADASVSDDKPLHSQRRPSVIQHTEYAATTPSPTISPKQDSSSVYNMYPKDFVQCVQFSNPKVNFIPNHMSYPMNGKVAEWLNKGVHEAVACKTPSSNMDKTSELHDKVMMPSSCKTPGVVGTGKIPPSSSKSKSSTKTCPKSPRSKYSTSPHRNTDSITNGNYSSTKNDVRKGAAYLKSFHPNPVSYSSVMTNPSTTPKYQYSSNPKPEFYPSDPYFNQQKRFKCNNMPPVLSGVGPRPSQLPFVRQQTYRASPLSDIPKATTITHNDYDAVVLDLSVKKKPVQTVSSKTTTVMVSTSPVPEEGVCLDLSMKKKPSIANDNGIENITPPLPLSPNPQPPPSASYLSSTLKPLPTLIAIQDFHSATESVRQSYSSSSSRLPTMSNPASSVTSGSSLVMPTNTIYPASTHSKIPSSIVNTISPEAYSKEIAKSLYMPSTTRHSQFPPYVIPSFFPSSWTVVNASSANPKQTNNSHTSPMAYKGMVNHSVFPKDYPSQYKSQYHPVLCKDNGHYPSSGK